MSSSWKMLLWCSSSGLLILSTLENFVWSYSFVVGTEKYPYHHRHKSSFSFVNQPAFRREVQLKQTGRYIPPDFSVVEDEDESIEWESDIQDNFNDESRPVLNEEISSQKREKASADKGKHEYPDHAGRQNSMNSIDRDDNWMSRNRKGAFPLHQDNDSWSSENPRNGRKDTRNSRPSTNNRGKSFREDYRGTRVFVQGIPPDASWQDLKDHFRIAGEVVFASVSKDPATGQPKGHGIVQFETTEMAQNAIAIMRDHPLNGSALFVREDIQEGPQGASLKTKRADNNIQRWSCADEDNSMHRLSDSDLTEVLSLIRARDDARRRRNYDVSDNIREELKFKFSVHLDDRLKMWWVSIDGEHHVPEAIHEIKGDGRWGKSSLHKQEWRQIPTTPEDDACVNPDLVFGLLAQRDIARREKDFQTADLLLEQARTAPDGDLYLRIHDESRTWRVWTPEPPAKPFVPHMSPAERCIAIVEEHAPEKVEEIRLLLENFAGREYKILKRLKQRYLQ